jgi:hypothetical protein
MWRPLKLGIVVIVVLGTPQLQTAEMSLVPIADSWIHGLGSSSTAGGFDSRVSICPRAGYWTYLKFDLSVIQGTVIGAELQLTRFDGDRPEEISVYRIEDDSWTEDGLSGVSRPEPRSPDPTSTLAMGEAMAGHDRWTSETLTNTIAAEVAVDGILTLMVREDPSDNFDVRGYFSREGAPAGDLPKLILNSEEPTSDETVGVNWRTVDVGVGTKPALDIGADGRVHVMAMTEADPGLVWYAAADAALGPWSPQTVSTGYFYGPGDIAVAADGVVHIAWHDHDIEDAKHITVASDDTVTFHPNTTPSHNGWDNAFAFDGDGNLHMASIDPSAFGALQGLEYNFFDGVAWSYEKLTESDAVCYGLATDIAIDGEGSPHIVYCAATGFTEVGDLTYVIRDDTGWIYEDIVTGGIVGRFPSLALDHWDRPHVAWLDIDSGNTSRGTVRYAVKNKDAWVIEDVDTLTNIRLGFSNARKSVSLVLDVNWRPHLAYSDKRIIRYAVKPFGDWIYETVVEHVADTYKGMVVMDLGPDDAPTLVFWETASFPDPGLVRIATRTTCEELSLLCTPFARGDCNGDGLGDVLDALTLLFHNFGSTPAPGCLAACDANGDGDVSGVTDTVYSLMYHFVSGSAPVAPFPACGLSGLGSDATLGCAQIPESCGL